LPQFQQLSVNSLATSVVVRPCNDVTRTDCHVTVIDSIQWRAFSGRRAFITWCRTVSERENAQSISRLVASTCYYFRQRYETAIESAYRYLSGSSWKPFCTSISKGGAQQTTHHGHSKQRLFTNKILSIYLSYNRTKVHSKQK